MVLIAIARASTCSFVFFCLSFFSSYSLPSEPVVTDYLKTDLVHMPVLIVYRYLELTDKPII